MARWGPVVLALGLGACAARGPARDVRDVAAIVARVHPDPDGIVASGAWEAATEAAVQELAPDAGPREVARVLAGLVTHLEDGHIRVGQPPLAPGTGLLPVRPTVVGDAWIVAAGPPDLVGRSIAAVDGRPVGELLRAMRAVIAVDGGRVAAADAQIRADPWRAFHPVHPPRASYTLTLEDGTEHALPGATPEAVGGLVSSAPALGWSREGAVGRLAVRSFGHADHAAFASRIHEQLEQLAADPVDTLILDLRGNAGGFRPPAIAVLQHLLAEPFTQWRSMDFSVEPLPPRLRRLVSVPFGLPADEIEDIVKRGRTFSAEGDPLAAQMTPREPTFDGEVVVWMDGVTASAAVELIAALRAHRPDVLLVGEETAGACDRHTGELPLAIRTAHAEVPVLLSLATLHQVAFEGCRPGHGVEPDVALTWTAAHVRAGTDPWEQWLAGRTPTGDP